METALLSEHGDCWPLIRADSKPASMSSMLCLSLFSVPPGPPFFVSSLSFSVFNVLCIFLSFLTPPSVSLQSLWTLHLLVFCFFVCFFLPTPHYLLSLSFFFPSLSQMGVCILLCRRWRVTPARSGERSAPRNSWRRRTFGCWVSRRRGVMQKP